MGNSLEFVKSRIVLEMCNNLAINDFGKAQELKYHDALNVLPKSYKELLKNGCKVSVGGTINGTAGDRQIAIVYNPDAEFEYFTMDSCVCDGTLLFLTERISNLFSKIIKGETYNNATAPDDYEDDPFKYSLKYTVGDFVINAQYGEFGTEEKPWLRERFTALLPIKCEYFIGDVEFNPSEGVESQPQLNSSLTTSFEDKESLLSNNKIWNYYVCEDDSNNCK